MGIMNKCNNLLSSLYKQIKPPRQPLQKIYPSPSPPSPPPTSPSPAINRNMGGTAQALKHIPRIKFPQRHPLPSSSGSVTQTQATPAATNDLPSSFFSKSAAPSEKTLGGKASLQPKRTPMTQEEIDAIMLGGCL